MDKMKHDMDEFKERLENVSDQIDRIGYECDALDRKNDMLSFLLVICAGLLIGIVSISLISFEISEREKTDMAKVICHHNDMELEDIYHDEDDNFTILCVEGTDTMTVIP